MADIPIALDPEVEALLREVAQDPRSTLLRVERPKAIRGLLEREPVIGVATAGLTTAERHLVQTKRADVAYALRVLSTNMLASDPRSSDVLSQQGVQGLFAQPVKSGRFAHELTATIDSLESIDLQSARGLRGSLAGTHPVLPTVLQLSAAAQRLEPTDNSRMHAATWFALEGQFHSEILILRNILTFRAPSWIEARAHTNLGFALHSIGKARASLNSYARGHAVDMQNFAAVGSLFIVAAQQGATLEFMSAAATLEEQWTADSSDVKWLRQSQFMRRSDPLTHLSSEGREMVARTRDRLGPTSRSLVDVLI